MNRTKLNSISVKYGAISAPYKWKIRHQSRRHESASAKRMLMLFNDTDYTKRQLLNFSFPALSKLEHCVSFSEKNKLKRLKNSGASIPRAFQFCLIIVRAAPFASKIAMIYESIPLYGCPQVHAVQTPIPHPIFFI